MLWWLLQNALGAAILAVVAALLSRTARLSPSARHALWLVVIVKLLAPPLLLWAYPGAAPIAPLASPDGQALLSPPATGISVLNLLAWAWLGGTALVALFQAFRLADLYMRLRGGYTPPEWMRDEAARFAGLLAVTPPRVVVVPSIGSPLLVGGLRPLLVVPEALLGRLDLPAWRSVLIHELAHLKRRDHWIGWIELAASCVWWWNPVFWHARRRLRENAEFACDAWVVRILPEGRRGYAESLIAVVDTLAWKPAPVAAIGMAAGGKRIFERRLEMILREAVPHRMSLPATVAALLTVLLVLPGWSHPEASATETTFQAPLPAVAAAQPEPIAQPEVIVPPAAIEASPEPAKLVKPTKAAKPATVKPKKQHAKRLAPATVAQDRVLQKSENAVVEPPAPTKPREETSPLRYALADEAPRASLDLTTPKATGSLQNVEVHGEVRIRYQSFSNR